MSMGTPQWSAERREREQREDEQKQREGGAPDECPEPDCRKVAGHIPPHFPVPGDGTPDSLRGGR
jgi:hypothetical protein